jgi:hypothetical protein
LAENVDKSISYSEYVAESVDKNIEYSKYLAEKVDQNISYSEYLAENVDNSISYSEHLAENLNKGIAYTEYVAEKLNDGIEYAEYLGENLNKNIQYSDYLAENLNKGLDYSEYLAEKVKRSISYSEYIAESLNNSDMKSVGQDLMESASVSASAGLKESGFAGNYDNLSDKIDSLVESVKTQKTESNINEASRSFEAPANTQKAQESALNENESTTKTGLKFIDEMPGEYKESWESLSEGHKNSIMAQASLRNLNTEYQIRDFWSTRNLGVDPIGLQKLNENQKAEAESEGAPTTSMGYSNDYVKNVAKMLEGKFGRR